MALRLPPALPPSATAPTASVTHVGANHAPPYQGRRLIQMLFRSSSDNASNDNDHRTALKTDVCGGDARTEDPEPHSSQLNSFASSSTPNSAMAATGGKFYSLKRKLFPNRVRRHPIRIPPLVTSPIAVQSNETFVDDPPRPSNQSECQKDIRQLQKHSTLCTQSPEDFIDREDKFSLSHSVKIDTLKTLQLLQGYNVERIGSMEQDEEEEDADLELERAIERLDNEASNEADALEEMSRAIEDLHKWRQLQQRETEEALRQIELDNTTVQAQPATDFNDDSANALEAEYEEKKKQRELQRQEQVAQLQHLSDAYQVALLKTTIDAHDEARVAQVLLENHRQELGWENDSNGIAALHYDIDLVMNRTNNNASRLRGDIFELGVRELSSAIQANLLDELEGADTELEMQLFGVQVQVRVVFFSALICLCPRRGWRLQVDNENCCCFVSFFLLQAFASDLDSVLAQFGSDGATAAASIQQDR